METFLLSFHFHETKRGHFRESSLNSRGSLVVIHHWRFNAFRRHNRQASQSFHPRKTHRSQTETLQWNSIDWNSSRNIWASERFIWIIWIISNLPILTDFKKELSRNSQPESSHLYFSKSKPTDHFRWEFEGIIVVFQWTGHVQKVILQYPLVDSQSSGVHLKS